MYYSIPQVTTPQSMIRVLMETKLSNALTTFINFEKLTFCVFLCFSRFWERPTVVTLVYRTVEKKTAVGRSQKQSKQRNKVGKFFKPHYSKRYKTLQQQTLESVSKQDWRLLSVDDLISIQTLILYTLVTCAQRHIKLAGTKKINERGF